MRLDHAATIAPLNPWEIRGWLLALPRMSRLLASFDHVSYRWYFASMSSSMTAMNVQQFVTGYMVFALTGSFALLGAFALAGGAPMLVFSPIGGVMADRVGQKKHLVIGCQFLNAVNVTAVAVMIFADSIAVGHLLAAALIQGTLTSFQMPARQALTSEVVDSANLTNALALNMATSNASRLLMPGLAGWTLGLISAADGIEGTEWMFVVIAACYATGGVLTIPIRSRYASNPSGTRLRDGYLDLVDGVRYVRSTPVIKQLLILNLVISAGTSTYFHLLAGFVDEVLDGSKTQLGVLTSMSGIGAFIGSMFVARVSDSRRGRLMIVTGLVAAVALVGFSLAETVWLSALMLVAVGAAQAGPMSLGNILLQAYSAPEFRGRIMALYVVEIGLTMSFSFAVGSLASVIGPQLAIGGTAAVLAIAMLWTLHRSDLVRLE